MRIAHLSDLHFGDPKTLAEVERCTGVALDALVAAGAELAVISGDTTDHALDVHSPSFGALARLVHRLAGHCPVLMLQGTFSHLCYLEHRCDHVAKRNMLPCEQNQLIDKQIGEFDKTYFAEVRWEDVSSPPMEVRPCSNSYSRSHQ